MVIRAKTCDCGCKMVKHYTGYYLLSFLPDVPTDFQNEWWCACGKTIIVKDTQPEPGLQDPMPLWTRINLALPMELEIQVE